MRAPEFWSDPAGGGWRAALLSPLSALWAGVTRRRLASGSPYDPGIPVICIGNVTSGGTGKTPFALLVAERLTALGRHPHFLSRGHGGRETGPLRVAAHDAAAVGDEPLLLAAAGPAWIARDRAAGARAIVEAGGDVIVMDDGFQNPALKKTLSFLVLDGGAGLGNGRVIPAGPLRETWAAARARAQAIVVVGDVRRTLPDPGGLPVLRAAITPAAPGRFTGRRVLAFAGIGRPAKFFDSLRAEGAELVAARAFADHHPYASAELAALRAEAAALSADLVTTAKDFARLPAGERRGIEVFAITLRLDSPVVLDQLLAGACHD